MINWMKIRVYLFILLFILGIGIMGYRYATENKMVYLGIDFAGGTRIPVLLEHAVDSDTMSEMVDTIKKRASSYALTEIKVRSLGSDEIVIEIPTSNENYVSKVEDVLSSRGMFTGVIDGKVAVPGDEIYQGSIYDASGSNPGQASGPGSWSVGFTVTSKGAKAFADAALGKPEYPIYMFLDRPTNAVILVPRSALWENVEASGFEKSKLSDSALLDSVRTAMKLEGDDVEVYILEDTESYSGIVPYENKTRAYVPDNADTETVSMLESKGYIVSKQKSSDFTLSYIPNQVYGIVPDQWPVAGLMNAPGISQDLSYGVVNNGFVINGYEKGQNSFDASDNAVLKKNKIMSLLKGGALPVQITLGSKTIIPSPLGGKFLELSVMGILGAIMVITVLIGVRYRELKVIFGLLMISLAEVVILIAIIGSFSIDLGAMAGIIAAVGVSVDSQIVITDEMLRKNSGTIEERKNRAFQIVLTTGGIAVITMVPLLFSGLTEVIGFAISTMLGSLIGMFLSRYTYAHYLEHYVLKEEK